MHISCGSEVIKSVKGTKNQHCPPSWIYVFLQLFIKQWVDLHRTWHSYSTKYSLSNDTKNIPIRHRFQGQIQGHSLKLCLTLRLAWYLTLETMSDWNVLGVIRCTISMPISISNHWIANNCKKYNSSWRTMSIFCTSDPPNDL